MAKKTTGLQSIIDGPVRLVLSDGTELVLLVRTLQANARRDIIDVTTFGHSTPQFMVAGPGDLNNVEIEMSAVILETGRTVVMEPLPAAIESKVARAISLGALK